jgi:hypothetical protein
MLRARDRDHDLVQMPYVPGCRKTPADLIGKALAELQRPLPHSLIAHLDTSCGQHLLDHAQAQGKAEVQPHSMADHFGWKAAAGLTRDTG